jgi:cytochrome P450
VVAADVAPGLAARVQHSRRGARRGVVDGLQQLQAFRRDPLSLLGAMRDGDVSHFSLGVRHAVVVTGEACAVALDHPQLVRCREPLGPLGTFAGQAPVFAVIGEGLPLLQENVKERRRHIGTALSASVAAIHPQATVADRVRAIATDEQRDGLCDLSHVVARVVCEQLCRRMFGELQADHAAALTRALDVITRAGHRQAVGSPLWSSWWGRDVRALAEARAVMRHFADVVSRSEVAQATPAFQAIQALAADVRYDEIVTQVLAGTETTTLTICWLLLLLERAPSWRARIKAEIDDGLDLSTLRLSSEAAIMRCLREALRLYPSFWQLFRVCTADCVVGDGVIAAGDIVFVDLFHTHRDPRRHREPHRFDPDRGAEATTFAFGSGSRSCIGARLAVVIILDVLSAILRDDHLRPLCEGSTDLADPREVDGLVFGLGRRGGFPARVQLDRP